MNRVIPAPPIFAPIEGKSLPFRSNCYVLFSPTSFNTTKTVFIYRTKMFDNIFIDGDFMRSVSNYFFKVRKRQKKNLHLVTIRDSTDPFVL